MIAHKETIDATADVKVGLLMIGCANVRTGH